MTSWKNLTLKVAAVAAAACTSVYAGDAATPLAEAHRLAAAPSPYSIELVDESGATLATYQRGDRFYVLGGPGRRYSVRIGNPTDRRVEAVLSIDGLDVIDGKDADLAGKRGYIVEPHGTLEVEGFRTSDAAVAAFRFSSVADSYAGRKGKARNVGVVGVAIFKEAGEPVVALPAPPPMYRDPTPVEPWYGERHERAPAPSADAAGSAGDRAEAAAPATPPSRMRSELSRGAGEVGRGPAVHPTPPLARPGLGTAFGEQRWSQVSFVRFVRRHPTRPDALAELRYNDADGLTALGIVIAPPYDGRDLDLRESADPFPATGYAEPPPYR